MEALDIGTRAFIAPKSIPSSGMRMQDRALLALAAALERHGYRFTCITPETHARVVLRRAEGPRDLRDVFGWSLAFDEGDLPREIVHLLHEADAVSSENGRLRSLVRFATFDRTLLVHSAWPTTANDSVFLGPDTYRFASLIEQALVIRPSSAPRTVVDLGCGTGAGGILAARLLGTGNSARVLLTDVNEQALRYARINAVHAGVANFHCVKSDVLNEVREPLDLIVANPPYLSDVQQRAYRHGGGSLGTGLSVRIVKESMRRLTPGGQLILYTASPIVGGVDTLRRELAGVLDQGSPRPFTYEYREIDPDVFGAELEHGAYAGVERIAVVGLTLRMT